MTQQKNGYSLYEKRTIKIHKGYFTEGTKEDAKCQKKIKGVKIELH
jgi:hypothetical protein